MEISEPRQVIYRQENKRTGVLSTGEQEDRSFIDRRTVEQELIVKGGLPAL